MCTGTLLTYVIFSGTSPQNSIDDILYRMSQAEQIGHYVLSQLYTQILIDKSKSRDTKANETYIKNFIFCNLNESYCNELDGVQKFSVIVYNPSSFTSHIWLRIPVQQSYTLDINKIRKYSIDVNQIGIIKMSSIFLSIPLNENRTAEYEVIVRVTIPPLSIQVVPFKATDNTLINQMEKSVINKKACSIENEAYIININKLGTIKSIYIKSINKNVELKQRFGYYYKGYEEIVQVYSQYANQSIRLYEKTPYIEFDWIVGLLNS
ncbi:unnamed protein product, partial [Didymodactylos carnosus]